MVAMGFGFRSSEAHGRTTQFKQVLILLCFVWLVQSMRYYKLTVECQMVLWLVVHEYLGS